MLPLFIGGKIKQRREELRLTQNDLSEKLNVSRASISNIESGRHVVQINTLYDLSEVLSVNVSFFLPNISISSQENVHFSLDNDSSSDGTFNDSTLSYIDDLIKNL